MSLLGLIVKSLGCEAPSEAVFCIDLGIFIFFFILIFFLPESVIGENGDEKNKC